jgi:hypothetical protein
MFVSNSFYVPLLYMPLDPEIWIPHFKFTLQTISLLYPQHPNDVTKKKYYDTIQNIPLFFPQSPLGNDFIKILDKYPVSPYLTSRESFMKWVHFIINKIHEKMDWEQEDFFDSLEKYYDSYKPKEVLNREKYKQRKQYVMIGIVLSIILVILWLLR